VFNNNIPRNNITNTKHKEVKDEKNAVITTLSRFVYFPKIFIAASAVDYSMLDIYDLCGSIALDDVPKYGFARKPDAVIIELGINDYVNGGLSSRPDVYAAGVRKFVGNLHEKYGPPMFQLYDCTAIEPTSSTSGTQQRQRFKSL